MRLPFDSSDAAARAVSSYLQRQTSGHAQGGRTPLTRRSELSRPGPASLEGLLDGLVAALRDKERELVAHQRLAETLRWQARHDPLTGAANRAGWTETLEQEETRCQRRGHPAGVVLVDLDDLKAINDAQGHAAGDALLVRAVAVLRTAVRGADTIARLGGDEFGVLAVECAPAALAAVVRRIRTALAQAGIAASVGAAPRVEDGSGLEGAVHRADLAMYADKRRNKGATEPPKAAPPGDADTRA